MLLLGIVFFPMVCSVISYIIGRRNETIRDYFVIFVTAMDLFLALLLPVSMPAFSAGGFLAGGISFVTDGFRVVYSIVTAVMWAGTTLFAKEYFLRERENLNRYWLFVLITLGATQGVMLSGDLLTAFLFFEILSFTSFTWVIHEETKEAVRAGYTYLFIAVIGGLVLFMGLLLLQDAAGTLSFAALRDACEKCSRKGQILAAGICILIGFGAKAGMFPVHVWLPKAHPVAPSPASALLSGVLTKVGIYGILMTTLQALYRNHIFGLLVFCLGVVTMVLGAVLALFSVNLKRTLACSSMSQVGFILIGTGMSVLLSEAGSEEGVAIALSGTMLHMLNHSLIKLTLFMAAGAVVMNLHELDLNRIRGWGRNKPFLKAAFALGACGISGIPLFNGYISKTLLHEGIVEGIHECAGLSAMLHTAEWVFLVSGGCTFAYMLKLFIAVFVEKNPERQEDFDRNTYCMNLPSTVAVFGSSLLMPLLGQPFIMKRLAAWMTGYEEILEFRAFTWGNLKGGLISLVIGLCVYLLFVRKVLLREGKYVNLWPEKLDLENLLYRPLLTRILPGIFGTAAAVFGENRVLKPLSGPALAGLKKLAALFGEDRILIPAAKGILSAMSFLAGVLVLSTDAIVVFLRKTVIRERVVRLRKKTGISALEMFGQGTADVFSSVSQNFSFALAMTCLGILVIIVLVIRML